MFSSIFGYTICIILRRKNMRNLLNRLERKLYRYNIPPFMRYLVFAMAGVFLLDLFAAMSSAYAYRQISVISYLTLNVGKVLHGEIWRLVTWLIVPPSGTGTLWALISVYFYYSIGTALENRWGVRRFFLYCVIGALANIIGAFVAYSIAGYAVWTNNYLYFSLFFAFAALYPDTQFLMFYVVPVKAKWLALIDAVYFLTAILWGGTTDRCAAIASLVNVALFFGQDLIDLCKREYYHFKRRQQFRR